MKFFMDYEKWFVMFEDLDQVFTSNNHPAPVGMLQVAFPNFWKQNEKFKWATYNQKSPERQQGF